MTDLPADSLRAHPAYVRYWCARVCSGFAFQILSVAAGWQVYDLTHRAFDLGLIGLVQFVPALLLALPAGHVADHYDRRRVVLLCVAVECVAIALLAVGGGAAGFSEVAIFATLFAIGVARAPQQVHRPTSFSHRRGCIRESLAHRTKHRLVAEQCRELLPRPLHGGITRVGETSRDIRPLRRLLLDARA